MEFGLVQNVSRTPLAFAIVGRTASMSPENQRRSRKCLWTAKQSMTPIKYPLRFLLMQTNSVRAQCFFMAVQTQDLCIVVMLRKSETAAISKELTFSVVMDLG